MRPIYVDPREVMDDVDIVGMKGRAMNEAIKYPTTPSIMDIKPFLIASPIKSPERKVRSRMI